MIKKQTKTFNAHNKQTNRIINVAYQFVLSQLNFPENNDIRKFMCIRYDQYCQKFLVPQIA